MKKRLLLFTVSFAGAILPLTVSPMAAVTGTLTAGGITIPTDSEMYLTHNPSLCQSKNGSSDKWRGK